MVHTKTCISRSQAAPLDIFLGMTPRTKPKSTPYNPSRNIPYVLQFATDTLALIMPEVSRFRELHVDLRKWNGDPESFFLALSLLEAAPSLTSLTILHAEPRRGTAADVPLPGTLPNIFSGNMPVLTRLTLESFTSWPSDYFHNLTHLCLFHQVPYSRPSTSAFLDFLECSPRLQELVLVDAGPTRISFEDYPRVSSDRCSVELSHLKELVIGEWPEPSMVRRLLTHLLLPTTTTIHVYGGSGPRSPGSDWSAWGGGPPPPAATWVPPPAPLGPALAGAGAPIGAGFPITSNPIPGDVQDDLHGITSFLPLDFAPTQILTELSLTRISRTSMVAHGAHYTVCKSELYVVDEYTNMDIRSLVLLSGLQFITTLVVLDATRNKPTSPGGWGGWPFAQNEVIAIDTWRVVFGGMTSLQALRIIQNKRWDALPVRTLLEALVPFTDTESDDATAKVPCPTLKTISLLGFYPTFPGFLISLAESRHEHGHALRSFEIHYDDNIMINEETRRRWRSEGQHPDVIYTPPETPVIIMVPLEAPAGDSPSDSDSDSVGVEHRFTAAEKTLLDTLNVEWERMKRYVETVVLDPCYRPARRAPMIGRSPANAGQTDSKMSSSVVIPPAWCPSQAYQWIHATLGTGSTGQDYDPWFDQDE
ncbi:hypothetical protein V5O48_018413 [Marasmius crinis-equi]|uniref:F-box domain-containing protein n=1 Tax=Marasmius crinis-equi TaxID=585013 RepID=A0ABR3ELA4_9AGAR